LNIRRFQKVSQVPNLERLGADDGLLAIVGSMHNTMTDKEVLRLVEEYNAT
jgi:hypothetical protein